MTQDNTPPRTKFSKLDYSAPTLIPKASGTFSDSLHTHPFGTISFQRRPSRHRHSSGLSTLRDCQLSTRSIFPTPPFSGDWHSLFLLCSHQASKTGPGRKRLACFTVCTRTNRLQHVFSGDSLSPPSRVVSTNRPSRKGTKKKTEPQNPILEVNTRSEHTRNAKHSLHPHAHTRAFWEAKKTHRAPKSNRGAANVCMPLATEPVSGFVPQEKPPCLSPFHDGALALRGHLSVAPLQQRQQGRGCVCLGPVRQLKAFLDLRTRRGASRAWGTVIETQ